MSGGHTTRRGRIVAEYDYTNTAGEPVFQVVRYEPKSFAQRRRDPKDARAWTWNVNGVPPLLYRASEVAEARDAELAIFVVEGEADVESLRRVGEVATCNAGGAGKFRPGHAQQLRDAHVIVVADRDAPGYRHARRVALLLAGVAASVRVMEPVVGKDVSDHLAASLGVNDLVEIPAVEPDEPDPEPPRATWDVLFARAVERAREEGRNNACLWLVCQLRDNDSDEEGARHLVSRFQAAVAGKGAHSFPFSEAMDVFDKNFNTPKREPWRPSELHRHPLTDYGNAERLVDRHGDSIRYVHSQRSWRAWDERRWAADNDGEVVRRAKDTIRALARVAADEEDEHRRKSLLSHAARSEGAARINAMIELAQSESAITAAISDFDADPWLFNVRNGTIHLRNGELLPHERTRMQSNLAPVEYDADAKAVVWRRFLERIMPSEEDRTYLQRAIGYSMTGLVNEHVLFLLFGTGANGKTTFLETVKAMLGTYAHTAPAELLLAKRPGTIPLEAAGLRGARFVSSSETEDGQRLAESAVKQLTGGDTITARKLYGDYFTFEPTHKLWLGTNHRPHVFGTDDAIWRRIHLVPFTITIPKGERDKTLDARLRDELPGILNWAVEGAIEWAKYGLGPSPNVFAASDAYRDESDVFATFLEEVCEVAADARCHTTHLYAAYKSWATDNGLRAMSAKSFGVKLAERGFAAFKSDGKRGWSGLDVRSLGADGKLRLVKGGES